MIKEALKTFGTKALTFTNKNAATILTVTAAVGVVTTSLLMAKAALSAKNKADEMKKNGHEPSKKDVAKETWYYFVPTAVSAGLTIGAVIAANQINLKNQAALVAAYAYGEKKLEEYQDKVVEIVGPNKDRKVRDAVAADKIKNNPPEGQTIIVTGGGDVLCYESISGRYFRSTVEKIRQAANEVNIELRSVMWTELNEFYYALGMQPIKVGDTIGFSVDKPIELDFSTQLTEDNQPCIVVDFKYGPGPRERY